MKKHIVSKWLKIKFQYDVAVGCPDKSRNFLESDRVVLVPKTFGIVSFFSRKKEKKRIKATMEFIGEI